MEGIMPTDLSNQWKDKICQYCVHAKNDKCLMGVPYYAVSYDCTFFRDSRPLDPQKALLDYLELQEQLKNINSNL